MIINNLFLNKASRSLSLFLVLILIGGCYQNKSQQGIPPKPVETALAIKQDADMYLEGFGNLFPPNNVDIKSQVTGTIQEVNFIEGKEVKKGDPLFTIDPCQYKAEFQKAEAALSSDAADLKLKKDTFGRNQKLFELKLISQQDFDKFKTDLVSSEAKVRLENANLELAKINLGYCYIRSPIYGLTGKRRVDVGNVVMGNDGPTLVNIKTIDPLYIDFTIAETELSNVRNAMKAGKLNVQVFANNEEDVFYSGELEMLDNSVDNTTGTVSLRAIVGNNERALWPGEFVKVRLILGTKKEAVLVPYEAVQLGQKRSYLFVIKPDNTAEVRLLKTGSRQKDYLVIEDGVKVGEKVVTSGQLGLSPGATVMDVTGEKAVAQ